MDLCIPRFSTLDQMGAVACDYIDKVLSGELKGKATQVVFSGNGKYISLTARSMKDRRMVRFPEPLDAERTLAAYSNLLHACGVDTVGIAEADLLSFQKELFERHGVTFAYADYPGDPNALFFYGAEVMGLVLAEFNPDLVTEE